MAFPIIRDPQVIHLFVDKFPNLLNSPSSAITEFYVFCQKNGINEISLYDTLSVLPSQSTSVSNFIYSAKTFNFIYEVSGTVNPYSPATLGLQYINLIVNYNNSQTGFDRKYDRITIENEFWNLETSINPLKNTTGYNITVVNGSATASIGGGIPSNIFSVGNMVKVFGQYRQVVSVNPTTITVDRPFTISIGNTSFEIRDNKVTGAETYAIDFQTFLERLKSIRNVAVANNIKVDVYLSRRVTQIQFLQLIPFIDRILIEADYDQNNYVLYNDSTQLNKIRDVLNRCTQNRTGTVYLNSGSNILNGIGTNFNSDLGVGTKITINNQIFTIQSIVSPTQAILEETNNYSTITNQTFKTYIEFLPIFYINKNLRKTWLSTPTNTKSYADVFKMFTLSGYTIGGSVQSGGNPICYNLEDNPSITGSTNLIGLSIFCRTEAQSIDINVAESSSPRSSATNPQARLIGNNNTYAITFTSSDCTCDNAVNGSVTANFSSAQPPPYVYTFTNGNRIIEITDSTTPIFTFNGLGTGTWQINVRDNAGATSTGSVTINETFQPTLVGQYVNATNGAITGNLIGGYQNYFIATMATNTTYDNNFFVSNLTNGSYTYGPPSNTNFTAGATYNFIIGDTDACIKLFNVRIPSIPTGVSITTQPTNPSCDAASNGSITIIGAGGNTPNAYTYYISGTTIVGSPLIINNQSINYTFSNLPSGTYYVQASNGTSFSTIQTVVLTETYSAAVNATSTSPNQVCFQLPSTPVGVTYQITSGGGTFQTFNQTVTGPNYNPCFNNLPGGQYSFNITSSLGCSEIVNLVVNNATITLLLNNYTNPNCTELNNGFINVHATSNGTGLITYTATNGTTILTNSTGVFNNLNAGTWQLTTSQNGIFGNTVVVPLNNTFYANVVSTGTSICVTASGGSLGVYTVVINGVKYPYNISLSANCYTGLCEGNIVRVVDGDIINTSISGCSYLTTTPRDCNFNFNVTANTITCGRYGSIFANADGGTIPYIYTIAGAASYSNTTGIFTSLLPGIYTVSVLDNDGNTGSTTVNLDQRVKFSATTSTTGTCVTIAGGIPPYYILINEEFYTVTNPGTYCYQLPCGYYGVNVLDSCSGTTCARYIVSNNGGRIPTQENIFWRNCENNLESEIIYPPNSPLAPPSTSVLCALINTVTTTNPTNISFTLTGFCSNQSNETCYIDTSVLEYIDCPAPLGIFLTSPIVNPTCNGSINGEISVSGMGGYSPYINYSATNGTVTVINSSGIFTGLSADTWTLYVEDSIGNITSTTVNLTTEFHVNFSFTSLTPTSVNVCASIPASTSYNPPYVLNILGNNYQITADDTNYCFVLTGVTNSIPIAYSACTIGPQPLCCMDGMLDLSGSASPRIKNLYSTTISGSPTFGLSLYMDPNPFVNYNVTIDLSTFKYVRSKDPNLYTVPTYGNYDIVIETFLDSYNLNTLHNFSGITANPQGSLIEAYNGIFYGVTNQGGISDNGLIFSCDTLGNYGVIHLFDGTNGKWPLGSLIETSNGIFYGVTQRGGINDDGTIYSCDTLGNFNIVYSFDGINGESPTGNLIKLKNGKLCGNALIGGTYNLGVIFTYDISTNIYSVIHTNDNVSGNYMPGSLIEASNGLIYGSSAYGGTYNYGTIFSCNTSGNYGIIHSFTGGIGGQSPYGTLLEASNGILYGTTPLGGNNNAGIIFSCNTSGNYGIIHHFDGSLNTGFLPCGELIEGSNGVIYGMTTYDNNFSGYGIIYMITVDGVFKTIKTFNYSELNTPNTTNGLLEASNQKLYGMTGSGGLFGIGGIFELDVNSTLKATLTINATTQCLTGVTLSTVWIDNTPHIGVSINNSSVTPPYEITIEGVTYLYNIANQTNYYPITGCTNVNVLVCAPEILSTDLVGYRTEYIFSGTSYSDGAYPRGDLMMNVDGLLYGMTSAGGANDEGLIFSFDFVNKIKTNIHDFTSSTGNIPYGTLQGDNQGNLYGVTTSGGTYGYGVLFSCTTAGNYTVMYNFDGANGIAPYTLPRKDLYTNTYKRVGTTFFGSPVNYGKIYFYDDNTYINFDNVGSFHLYGGNNDFNRVLSTGVYPISGPTYYQELSITFVSSTYFIGTTLSGGTYGAGTIYIYDVSTYGIYDIHSFNPNLDGGYPYASPYYFSKNGASSPMLYGVTSGLGGASGTIYSIDITNGYAGITYNVEHVFGGSPDGASPIATLYENNGKFYGTTLFGGSTGFPGRGTIYTYDPSVPINQYNKIYDFVGGSDGEVPYGGLILASDGKLYGMTNVGGFDQGVIYSIDFNLVPRPACCYQESINIFDTIPTPVVQGEWINNSPYICIDFDYDNFYNPPYEVTIGSKTYFIESGSTATTFCYSAETCGTYNVSIESIAISDSFYELEFVFEITGEKPITPMNSLIEASNGIFYGTTLGGGINGGGTIFSCNTQGDYGSIHSFDLITDGYYSYSNLLEISSGVMYGMTSGGISTNIDAGIIFSCDTSGNYEVVYEFRFTNAIPVEGSTPYGSLILCSDGKLYGLTSIGGSASRGTLFSFDTTNRLVNYVYIFGTTGLGTNPNGTLIEPEPGFLFGTLSSDRLNGDGVIFGIELNGSNYYEQILDPITQGKTPLGSLIIYPPIPNRLYGTTSDGGIYPSSPGSYGTIFYIEYNIGTTNFTIPQKIYDFDGINGANPKGDLLLGSDGLLYGMAYAGGNYNKGVIFRIDPITFNYEKIFDFRGDLPPFNSIYSGRNPQGNLIQASNGRFYGMTPYVQNSIYGGTMFSFDPTLIYEECTFNTAVTVSCAYLQTIEVSGSCTGNTGFITVTSLGNNPNYTYTLTNGVTTYGAVGGVAQPITFNNLSPSIWTLTVVDNIGQTSTQTYDLTNLTIFSLTINELTNTVCINVDLPFFTGLTLDGQYIYSGPARDSICFTANCGNHVAIFYSPNGCITEIPINYECPEFTLYLEYDNPFCCTSPAQVILEADGGLAPYLYTVHNLPNTATYSNTTGLFQNIYPPTGTWVATVTDSNGDVVTSNLFTLDSIYSADILFVYDHVNISFSGGDYTIVTINGISYTYNVSSSAVTFPLVCGIENIVTVVGYSGQTNGSVLYPCDIIYTVDDFEAGLTFIGDPDPLNFPDTGQRISRFGYLYITRGATKMYMVSFNGLGQYFILSQNLSAAPNMGFPTILYTLPLPNTIKGIALKQESPDVFFVINTNSGFVEEIDFTNSITTQLFQPPIGYSFTTLPYDGYDTLYYDSVNSYLHIVFGNPNRLVIFDLLGNIVAEGAPPTAAFPKNSYVYNGQTILIDTNGVAWDASPNPLNPTSLIFTSLGNFSTLSPLLGLTLYNNGICVEPQICFYSGSTYFPCPLICDYFFIQPRCEGENAESITVYITGGTPSYNITLTDGTLVHTANTSSTIYIFNDTTTPLPEGNWTLTVIDSDGGACIDNFTIAHTFVGTITGSTTGACFTVTGGLAPYTLYIDGVLYTPLINQVSNDIVYCLPLNCGTHTLEIIETSVGVGGGQRACSIELLVTISCDLSCTTVTTDPGCGDNCNGSITTTVFDGVGLFHYTLTQTTPPFYQTFYVGPQNSWTFYNLCEGTYDITVSSTTNAAYCTTTNLLLQSAYDVIVTAYANSGSCATGFICIDISGGTPPYDVYIDDILYESATTNTHLCYTATCGTNHSYFVIDSALPCSIGVNQELFSNSNFTGNTDWILGPITSNCTPLTAFSANVIINNGFLTYTSMTASNCLRRDYVNTGAATNLNTTSYNTDPYITDFTGWTTYSPYYGSGFTSNGALIYYQDTNGVTGPTYNDVFFIPNSVTHNNLLPGIGYNCPNITSTTFTYVFTTGNIPYSCYTVVIMYGLGTNIAKQEGLLPYTTYSGVTSFIINPTSLSFGIRLISFINTPPNTCNAPYGAYGFTAFTEFQIYSNHNVSWDDCDNCPHQDNLSLGEIVSICTTDLSSIQLETGLIPTAAPSFCAGINGTCVQNETFSQNFSVYSLLGGIVPLSIDYRYTFITSAMTLYQQGSNNLYVDTPFNTNSTLIETDYTSNNLYTGTFTVNTNTTPLVFSGYSFSFSNQYEYNTMNIFQMDFFQLTLLSYTVDCRCSASGSTFIPCNPPLDIVVYNFVPADCYGGCNGSITVSASGGVPPYTYTATNGTEIIINYSGAFLNLCSDDWDLFVSDFCGTIATLPTAFTLPSEFQVVIDTQPTQFCVSISGGTPDYTIFVNNTPIFTTSIPDTYCFSAECDTTLYIRVTDSSTP